MRWADRCRHGAIVSRVIDLRAGVARPSSLSSNTSPYIDRLAVQVEADVVRLTGADTGREAAVEILRTVLVKA
jgi:hypothetical protein